MTTEPAERPDAVSAMVSAQASGVRVEDVSQRTESTQTFANPDGTWSTEMATGPVRVQRENGSWVDIDTTLVQNAAGDWVPRATAAEVSFSDGGAEPFATMEPTDGSSFGLTWPEPLPAPEVLGSTLTYTDVVPNGDLVVQALPGGFSHEIVLHQAPSQPVDYQIPLELDGLSLVEQANGAISVQTTAGKEVASAPAPLMWDHEDGPAGEPETVAPLDTTVDGTGADAELVLTPDMGMLTDPATQFPVTLDPTFSKTPFRDVWVQNADYTNGQVGSPELRAGTYDGGGHKARSFVDFDTANLNGKHILSATLKLRNFYSGSCANGAIRANAINESWNKDNLTWANQPDVYPGNYDDYANAYGYTGCPEAGWAQWNVLDMVRQWTKPVADGGWVNRGIRLKAVDETSNATWRKYRSANYTTTTSFRPHLEVTYNSYPDTPGVPSVSPVAGSTTTGLVTRDATPTLSAKVSDPDGGKVRGYFEVRGSAGTLIWSGTSTLVTNGSTASVTVPAGELNNGWNYTIDVFGDDDTNRSKNASSTAVKVDTQAPATPSVAASAHSNGAWSDTVPASNTFTFSSTVGDVTSFSYAKDDAGWVSKTASSAGDTALSWNPSNGAHRLRVKAIDKVGNTTTITTFTFGVGGVELARPLAQQSSAQYFAVSATAPPGATSAALMWRQAGTTAWAEVPSVAIRNGAEAWTGSVLAGSTDTHTPELAWDVTSTPGMPEASLVDIQVCFEYINPSATRCSAARTVQRVPHAPATVSFGPGMASPHTGELWLTATDATAPGESDLTVDRSHLSLTGDSGTPGIFGPGWSGALPSEATDALDAQIIDHSAQDGSILVVYADGVTDVFIKTGGGPGTYAGVGETSASGSTLELSSDALTLSLTDAEGTRTVWVRQSVAAAWSPDHVAQADAEDAYELQTGTYTSPGPGHMAGDSWVRTFAPSPTGVDCSAALVRGCKALTVVTSSPSTLQPGPGSLGDYPGRARSVLLSIWDPAANGGSGDVVTRVVAEYRFDADGYLRQVWDPRQDVIAGQHLVTSYDYDSQGRIWKVASPGQEPWTFQYDAAGRVTSATRYDAALMREATTSIVYDVPLAGAGLPDMTAATTATWGQPAEASPRAAAAVFPPHHRPSTPVAAGDWVYARLLYLSQSGSITNEAAFGAGDWQISTSIYDDKGQLTSTLSPGNRKEALQPTEQTDPAVASVEDSVARAQMLSDMYIYDPGDSALLTDKYGPVHQSKTEDGSIHSVRLHTKTVYDAGAPESVAVGTETFRGPWRLATSETTSAYQVDSQNPSSLTDGLETDSRVVTYGYAPLSPGDGNGWALGKPTTTTIDPSGLNLVTYVRFDSAGREIERRPPGSAPSGDARATRTIYYTSASNPADPSCGGRPEWDGLTCRYGPAVQPTSGPSIPSHYIPGYNYLLQPTERIETSSGSAVRTTTYAYDDAGRVRTKSVRLTGVPDSHSLPAVAFEYDPQTGLQSTISAGPTQMQTLYDSWGRTTTYTDATGVTSTVAYDIAGRVSTLNDGKGTYTFTYDRGANDPDGPEEHRGLLTEVNTDLAGVSSSFSGSYDAAGKLIKQTYPNGLVASASFDATGYQTSLTYESAATSWLTFTRTPNPFGQTAAQTEAGGEKQFGYDDHGRLTSVRDTDAQECITRVYSFAGQAGADSNRTRLDEYPPGTDGACSTATPPVSTVHAFDDADRLVSTGYAYDSFGRTRSIPTADTSSGVGDVTAEYYDSDMIAQLEQGNTTWMYELDPAGRVLTSRESTDGIATRTIINHYQDTSDIPSWSEEAGSWTRYVRGLAGQLAAVEASDGSVTLQLTDIHGDVVAVVDGSSTATGPAATYRYDEFGKWSQPGTSSRYGWLGSKQRSTDTVGGLILMGARVYNPATGRFLQRDPVAGGNDNPYIYPPDPVNSHDWQGTDTVRGDAGLAWLWVWYIGGRFKVNVGFLLYPQHYADSARATIYWNTRRRRGAFVIGSYTDVFSPRHRWERERRLPRGIAPPVTVRGGIAAWGFSVWHGIPYPNMFHSGPLYDRNGG